MMGQRYGGGSFLGGYGARSGGAKLGGGAPYRAPHSPFEYAPILDPMYKKLRSMVEGYVSGTGVDDKGYDLELQRAMDALNVQHAARKKSLGEATASYGLGGGAHGRMLGKEDASFAQAMSGLRRDFTIERFKDQRTNRLSALGIGANWLDRYPAMEMKRAQNLSQMSRYGEGMLNQFGPSGLPGRLAASAYGQRDWLSKGNPYRRRAY